MPGVKLKIKVGGPLIKELLALTAALPGVESILLPGGLYRLVSVLKYHRKVLLRDALA